MKLIVVYRPSAPVSASPYRLLDQNKQEIVWANAFLDAQRIRQLSLRSLRVYAYDLLHFARWWEQVPPRPLSEITESVLLDYARHQLEEEPKPSAPTVNHRLRVLHLLYRFHFGCEIPDGQFHFRRTYTIPSPLDCGRPHRTTASSFRLREPRPVILPLSAEEVAKFWASFRTFRDLALVGLMLLDGLRTCEVLDLRVEDLRLADSEIFVHGKGGKTRSLPLPGEIAGVLQNYLRMERPLTNSPFLFVCMKAKRRGHPMTITGLRALFRYHRLSSGVPSANPHRFRHTFGADMVRAGISLPALQRLMGHAYIQTTMVYVQLAPQDVWREYARAVENRAHWCPNNL